MARQPEQQPNKQNQPKHQQPGPEKREDTDIQPYEGEKREKRQRQEHEEQ